MKVFLNGLPWKKKNSLKTVDDVSALENREYKPTAIGFDQSFFGSADIKKNISL